MRLICAAACIYNYIYTIYACTYACVYAMWTIPISRLTSSSYRSPANWLLLAIVRRRHQTMKAAFTAYSHGLMVYPSADSLFYHKYVYSLGHPLLRGGACIHTGRGMTSDGSFVCSNCRFDFIVFQRMYWVCCLVFCPYISLYALTVHSQADLHEFCVFGFEMHAHSARV